MIWLGARSLGLHCSHMFNKSAPSGMIGDVSAFDIYTCIHTYIHTYIHSSSQATSGPGRSKPRHHRREPHRSGFHCSACGTRMHQNLTAATLEERLHEQRPQLQLDATPSPTRGTSSKDCHLLEETQRLPEG